nr:unnamed protein product [Callosobruchus chinensis]
MEERAFLRWVQVWINSGNNDWFILPAKHH